MNAPNNTQDAMAAFSPATGSANPASQPCSTCRHFHGTKNAGQDGWCKSIEDDVKSWWTGCIRHSPNEKLSDGSPTKT